MSTSKGGSRYNLGEELTEDLADLCEAYFGAAEVRIIREAVRGFIDARLEAEPEVKKRFKEARKRRLGQNQTNGLHIVGGEDDRC